jgi:hypothetical protein
MQRRSFLLLSILSLGTIDSFRFKAWGSELTQPSDAREQARQLNQLATNVKTLSDARILVDYVADLFAESVPAAWVSNSIRKKIANAEFAAVSDAHELIPEERIARAWNAYADTIQAPQERRVTEAEVHNLRDALFTTANLGWKQGKETIWNVPTIYPTQPNGSISSGCRAIETIRVLWDLSRFPQNILSARLRVSEGVLNSELFRTGQESRATAILESVPVTHGPVYSMEREYVAANGNAALYRAVDTLLKQALT